MPCVAEAANCAFQDENNRAGKAWVPISLGNLYQQWLEAIFKQPEQETHKLNENK